jgi:hypothetical protein
MVFADMKAAEPLNITIGGDGLFFNCRISVF